MSKTEFHGKLYTINEKADGVLEFVPVKPEVKGLWRPEKGGSYYYVSNLGPDETERTSRTQHSDERVIARGNCFPSQDIAEKAAPLMARANKIIAAALQADPDAGERSVERQHSVALGSAGFIPHHRVPPDYPLIVFVHTTKQADEMAKILNEEGVK